MPAATRLLLILLVPAVAAGCATSVAAQPPAPGSPEPRPTEVVDLRADWTDDDVEVTLDNGWTVRGCEGSAPLLCVRDGDRLLGDVELGQYPAGEDLLAADDLPTALRADAGGFLDTMGDDRAVACPGYAFAPLPVTDAVVDGEPAVRTGFVLRDDTGREVERVVVHVTVREGTMWTVNASGYAPDGGCLPAEQDFDPATLEEFEPYLDALVRDTPLPAGHGPAQPAPAAGPLVDGDHTVRAAVRSDGLLDVTVVELLTGTEAVAAARADGAIGPDEDLPNGVYLRDPGAPSSAIGLAPGATVAVIDCATTCQPVTVDREAFVTGRVAPFNGELAVHEATVVDGTIVELSEVYLP